ncbi:hypothetical protein FKZ61_022960 [Litorilinea aerophila]|uniref:Uncharacterized protein n=1 Tax=Litorilinea aerophila TaxID=1204385 RepID=A0A540V8R1_9CHLR|nr:hypothetical protein [Litorilinea aerophila]MCC9078958.1 hypothetical protein [Litorilinea aerophila]OUC05325.1 hypothetical protein RY27_27975 [Litorilinea aerophila]GIV79657.1 MAG: hypothetical protein KatS3mg050_4051 [Litorilinea sp.]GIV80577.1 MAG: hypothetical protein KatS3mg050_4971 [Litorilinea sp.]
MSISAIVDTGYRLHPHDLGGRARTVTVVNVSFQGVETLAPVLHLAETPKRLVLTPDQIAVLITLSGSLVPSTWIGLTVELHPTVVDGQERIEIRPARGRRIRPWQPPPPQPAHSGWPVVVLVLLVALVLAALFLRETGITLDELLRLL